MAAYNAYVLFVILFSVIIWPVAFIVALIVKLTNVKKLYREMLYGNKELSECADTVALCQAIQKKKHRERIENTIVAVASVIISAVFTVFLLCNL